MLEVVVVGGLPVTCTVSVQFMVSYFAELWTVGAWHLPSIGLFGRGGWSVGFLNGAIWQWSIGWGLCPTPSPATTARLTMGGIHRLSTGSSMPCMAPMGYPQVAVYISVDICGTFVRGALHHVTFVTCDVRHAIVTTS